MGLTNFTEADFPTLLILEVVSQPSKQCKSRNALHMSKSSPILLSEICQTFFDWFSLDFFPLRKYSAWVSEACLCLLPQYNNYVRYRGLLSFWQSWRQHHFFHWTTFISLLFIASVSMSINHCYSRTQSLMTEGTFLFCELDLSSFAPLAATNMCCVFCGRLAVSIEHNNWTSRIVCLYMFNVFVKHMHE